MADGSLWAEAAESLGNTDCSCSRRDSMDAGDAGGGGGPTAAAAGVVAARAAAAPNRAHRRSPSGHF